MNFIKKNALKLSTITGGIVAIASKSFAAEPGLSGVATQITTAGTEMLTSAVPVISGAIGVGIVFWGGKLLWSKFKSMAN